MTDSQTITEIQTIVRKHQKKQCIYQGNSIPEQFDLICEQYQRAAEDAYASAAEFRDRLLVDFRALNLILTSCQNSETHKEKDAHLRILSKLLSSAAEHLRKIQFDACWGASFFFNRDPFQCDFPVREMKNRIHQLEQQLAEATRANDHSPSASSALSAV